MYLMKIVKTSGLILLNNDTKFWLNFNKKLRDLMYNDCCNESVALITS